MAENSWAATINAASCSYESVNSALDSASAGDVITVPAGTCTWSNKINITKAVSIIGAGIGETIINNAYAPDLGGNSLDPAKHLISIIPASPETNPFIRISGFTFNFGSSSFGIYYANPSTIYDCTNVRLDHLEISAVLWLFQRYGLAHGVMDNCIIKGHMDGGGSQTLWTTNGYEFGTASNFYIEDCDWSAYSNSSEIYHAGNGAFRYAFRHNNIVLPTDTQTFPLFDQHGNQGNQISCFGAEIYENNIIANNISQRWFNMIYDQRGGKSIVFNNTVTWVTAGVDVGFRVREEHLDTDTPPAVNVINGQPQHISDSYYWGNTKNGAAIIPALSDEIGIGIPKEDEHVWLEKTSFNGTAGVGVGLLEFRPITCVKGVGYWATDENRLYRCSATNVWTAFYTPYTYPHPLRNEDNDTTPPAVPSGLVVN